MFNDPPEEGGRKRCQWSLEGGFGVRSPSRSSQSIQFLLLPSHHPPVGLLSVPRTLHLLTLPSPRSLLSVDLQKDWHHRNSPHIDFFFFRPILAIGTPANAPFLPANLTLPSPSICVMAQGLPSPCPHGHCCRPATLETLRDQWT